MFNQR